MCELLKTLLHQVHCHQLSRGRVWAVYVASGPWNHALTCHLSGKWLLAGIPSRLKVLRSLGPSQRSLILRVYPGKDVWKAKGNLQGRWRGVPLRRALWRTGRGKQQPLQHLCNLEDDQGEKQGQRFLQTGERRNAS